VDALDQLVRDLEAERYRPPPRPAAEQLAFREHAAGLDRQRVLAAESLAYDRAHRDENRRQLSRRPRAVS
jgi:hypothetical protein